ncbi:hypothetical protein IEO21_04112 [Rhodonia placenta]|uniref:Uncharacterized protein n=1 Tax=Rhodonia placenta TaxID=104341 RepID=A0A8H7P4S4_9APHY|nr:hypothetical protein IEO21_04112 [Postia placenta]
MSFESDTQLPPLQFKGEIMDFDLGLDIDHRKRRRNRTTQSCLNCHTSKRKKETMFEVYTAWARMTPTSTRLHVSEIGSRSSKVWFENYGPHPKWAEPNYCDGDSTEKWHSRSSKRLQTQKTRRDLDIDGSHSGSASIHLPSTVKIEQAAELSQQQQLYRVATSSSSSTLHDAHSASQSYYRTPPQTNSQPFGSPTDDSAAYYSSSSSNSPLGYEHRYNDGSVHAGPDHYAQSYVRPSNNSSSTIHVSCPCLTNPAAGNPLIALTNQLRNTLHQLRQLPEHHSHNDCLVLTRILDLDDTMHGSDPGYHSDTRYDGLPTPTDSELLSPTSSSGHSGLGNNMQDWQAMSHPSGYDHYFQVSSGEHATYQKPYHIVQ